MVSATNEQRANSPEKTPARDPKQGGEAPLAAPKIQDFLKTEASRVSEDTVRVRSILNVRENIELKEKNLQAAHPHTHTGEHSHDHAKHHGHHNHHMVGGETALHEQRDRIAFRYVGPASNQNQNPVAKDRQKDPWSRAQGLPGEDQSTGAGDGKQTPLSGPVTGTQGAADGAALASRSNGDAQPQNRAGAQTGATAAPTTALQAQEQQSVQTKQEPVRVLDLVGPEAVLNLRERLREVWVDLDNTADTELDVIARMPASEMGLSSAELLSIRSPQGIHFVAFLKNKNDFEVLQTFDRHALLPGDPNKQLLEAAVMAYEQLGAVFTEASGLLEKRVGSAQSKPNADPNFLNGMRGQWIQAKRRSKKCSDLVDQLIEEIDELELKEEQELKNGEPAVEAGEERVIKKEFERPVLENGEDA